MPCARFLAVMAHIAPSSASKAKFSRNGGFSRSFWFDDPFLSGTDTSVRFSPRFYWQEGTVMRSSFRHRFASSTSGVIGVGLVVVLVLTVDGGN